MRDFFQNLTADERRAFGEIMAMRDAEGRLLKTADEVATELLKAFVTREGNLEPSVELRLGGQPEHGRADVLVDLIRALTGPHPLPQAWIEAMESEGFNLFEPQFYRSRNRKDRKIGSPGTFLPRMVAQYHDDVNNRRVRPASNAALYTEAAMLTVAMLLRELKGAVCAKQALGPAWVVGLAVNALPSKTKRQMDALALNDAYKAALGTAIAGVTTAFVTPDLNERSNEAVHHSLPPGADLETFFAGQDQRQLVDTVDALVSAVERRANEGVDRDAAPHMNGAADRLMAAIQRIPPDQIELNARVRAATSYLDESPDETRGDLAGHHELLRFLMPGLSSDDNKACGAVIVRTINGDWFERDKLINGVFPNRQLDPFIAKVSERIRRYALDVGPPPPNTPADHIAIFEAAVCMALFGPKDSWDSRARWREAGLIPKALIDLNMYGDANIAVSESGVRGFNLKKILDEIEPFPF